MSKNEVFDGLAAFGTVRKFDTLNSSNCDVFVLGEDPGSPRIVSGECHGLSLFPDYAGDISAAEAWELLKAIPRPSWWMCAPWRNGTLSACPTFRPGPRADLHRMAELPTMRAIPDFVAEAEAGPLARPGRAGAAALPLGRALARRRHRADAGGLHQAFNIAGGFEGDLDGEGHRGNAMAGRPPAFPGDRAEQKQTRTITGQENRAGQREQ